MRWKNFLAARAKLQPNFSKTQQLLSLVPENCQQSPQEHLRLSYKYWRSGCMLVCFLHGTSIFCLRISLTFGSAYLSLYSLSSLSSSMYFLHCSSVNSFHSGLSSSSNSFSLLLRFSENLLKNSCINSLGFSQFMSSSYDGRCRPLNHPFSSRSFITS